jgi:hypothetical protein
MAANTPTRNLLTIVTTPTLTTPFAMVGSRSQLNFHRVIGYPRLDEILTDDMLGSRPISADFARSRTVIAVLTDCAMLCLPLARRVVPEE